MAVLRMQFSKLLFILFVIGFIANDVNGACHRPNFTDPYAIILDPDQELYGLYDAILFSCKEGHTTSGLPTAIYCFPDGNWDSDVSGGRCYAQCNTTKLISDDDVKVTDDSGVQRTVFNHGENANFECNNKSQSSGAEQGTCNNGTLTIQDEPSCLAYCPVYIAELGIGLYYDIAVSPVINETNTLYYRDEDVITYRCLDGYEGPQNRTQSDDGTSTCNDGSWDPPGIPTCMVIGATTERTTDITASPGSTSEPVLTTDYLEVTTMELRTPPTLPETEKPPITPLPCGGGCNATQLCNAENNCECRPDYYEDEEDPENPCKEPESFDVTITITEFNNTNAEYKVELEDPSSLEFKMLEIDVCEPFEEIYEDNPEYIICRVLEFSNGSIIVNYVLTFAENSTQSASTVNTTVQQELQNPNGSFTGAYEFDDSSLVVAPLDECNRKIDDCDPENAICIDQGADGYTCECREGFDDVGIPDSLPGRECMKSTEPQPTEPHPTEPQPTDPRTTEEPQEPGPEPWKIVVGVTVPIIAIIIVGLACWQYRRLHRTSTSVVTNSQTIQFSDDTSGSSDPEAVKPGSMTIMNDYGTVQEVVLPMDDIPLKEESNFVSDKD